MTVRTTSGYVSSQERGTINHKNQVLARWKEHFEEQLIEGSESEQPTRPVDLRYDEVDIDLPSREKIEGALKYLNNNKAADADSIAAELLKNGGPNLVDALQQAWTSKTLPRSWTEGVLVGMVLEVIVRRANLQTTGAIYNKETQLLAYADDIDIVGRSQSAVQNAYLALEREAAKVVYSI
jgi:hypothetical protein